MLLRINLVYKYNLYSWGKEGITNGNWSWFVNFNT